MCNPRFCSTCLSRLISILPLFASVSCCLGILLLDMEQLHQGFSCSNLLNVHPTFVPLVFWTDQHHVSVHKTETLPRLRLLAFCLLLFGSLCFLPLSRLLALLRPFCNLPLRSSLLPGVPICLLNCEQRTCLRSEPDAAAKGRRPEADGRRAQGGERRPKVVKFCEAGVAQECKACERFF